MSGDHGKSLRSRIFGGRLVVASLAACLAWSLSVPAAGAESKPGPVLKKGARVAIAGDSITEGGVYSGFIELYLAACQPELDLQVRHMGWSGATVQAFRGRQRLHLLPYKPDVAIVCLGGADGGYTPFTPQVGEKYSTHMGFVVETLKNAGAVVVVGSPCPMDPRFAVRKVYNDGILKLRDLARTIAQANEMPFADVNGAMLDAMAKSKAAIGEDYPICGRDGIHPGYSGSLVIAYTLLKTMDVDGNIGTIMIDMKGPASAAGGHKVVSSQEGKAEIESARYPFCFEGDANSPDSARSILPFVPFNQELNRFTLTVKNLESENARVTWGTASKVFTRKELQSGINLAEAFVGGNPFSEAFKKAAVAVTAKQTLETRYKRMLDDVQELMTPTTPWYDDPDAAAMIDRLRKKMDASLDQSRANIRGLLSPLKHTLTVTPEP